MRRFACLAALLAAFAFSGICGTVTYSFGPSIEVGLPGATLVFPGTILAGDADTFLIDITFDLGPVGNANIFKDPNFFFANVPGLFEPTDQYDGPILELMIGPGIPYGRYTGTATLLGGADEFSLDPIATTALEVDVVPEPATGLLTLAALILAAATLRGSKKNRAPVARSAA